MIVTGKVYTGDIISTGAKSAATTKGVARVGLGEGNRKLNKQSDKNTLAEIFVSSEH